MGKSSGNVRRGGGLNAEVQWRVRQTQAQYDSMSASERESAINTLRNQYNSRRRSIELLGSDSSDTTLLRATEALFRINRLKL